MKIKDVRIRMQRRGETFLPTAVITYQEATRAPLTVVLDEARPTFRWHHALVSGTTFFAALVDGSYLLYDEQGRRQGRVPMEGVGLPHRVEHDKLICRLERQLTEIDAHGNIVRQHQMTDEDYALHAALGEELCRQRYTALLRMYQGKS